jgi:hypothetical protein
MTCFSNVHRFIKRNGYSNLRALNGYIPITSAVFNKEVRSFLMDEVTAQEWGAKPIDERCRLIKEKFNMSVTPSALR